MRIRRSPRLVGAVCAVAGIAMFAALFLPWYDVTGGSVMRGGPDGFVLVFGHGSADAWNSISLTSYALAGCALLIVASAAIWVFRGSRAASLAALGASVLAVGVVGWRVLEPPSHGVDVGIAGYFSRSAGPSLDSASEPLDAASGAFAALGAALVAATAAGTLVLASLRQST